MPPPKRPLGDPLARLVARAAESWRVDGDKFETPEAQLDAFARRIVRWCADEAEHGGPQLITGTPLSAKAEAYRMGREHAAKHLRTLARRRLGKGK